jgi:glycerophosphoryl diester phosphodiesterase
MSHRQKLLVIKLRRNKGERILIIGHRGAMGHAPENTMASFAMGLAMGADAIELDVHLSANGHLVVIHDSSVDRTTNGSGYIKDLTLAEIKSLDAGSWYGPEFAGERIPTLDEVLAWAKGRISLVIEIKNSPVFYPGIEEKVVEALKAHGMEDAAVVISFDHRSVKKVKELRPGIATGILYVARPVDAVSMARTARADAIHPNVGYLTAETVGEAHRAGLAVSTWIVNDPLQMRKLADMGVDSVGTNYPDRLCSAL